MVVRQWAPPRERRSRISRFPSDYPWGSTQEYISQRTGNQSTFPRTTRRCRLSGGCSRTSWCIIDTTKLVRRLGEICRSTARSSVTVREGQAAPFDISRKDNVAVDSPRTVRSQTASFLGPSIIIFSEHQRRLSRSKLREYHKLNCYSPLADSVIQHIAWKRI